MNLKRSRVGDSWELWEQCGKECGLNNTTIESTSDHPWSYGSLVSPLIGTLDLKPLD